MKAEQVKLEWTDGNNIRLLQNGSDFFPALCAAIDAAQVSVHLETYIFMVDRTGSQVLECLTAAARRGVKVRVVLDGFGSATRTFTPRRAAAVRHSSTCEPVRSTMKM